MMQFKLENSPIVYYISGREHKEWTLFLHAAFVDHNMFNSQLEYFGDKYNLMTLDIIGHGLSTQTQKGDSIAKMTEWTHRILKKEDIDRLHIVGISLGSVLAQDFAKHYPGAVRSLACFGGYDINSFDPKLQSKNGAAQALMMLRAVFSVKWFAESNKKISAYTPQAQEEFYRMNLKFPRKSFMYLSTLGKMVNSSGSAVGGYPLLIGCGEHDVPMELSAIEMWRKSRPDCKVKIFEDAGHCVNMDVPQQFNKVLEDFFVHGGQAVPAPNLGRAVPAPNLG